MDEQQALAFAAQLAEQEERYWRQQYQTYGNPEYREWERAVRHLAARLRTGSTLVPIGEHRIKAGVNA